MYSFTELNRMTTKAAQVAAESVDSMRKFARDMTNRRVKPEELSPETRAAILELKRCLAREGWFDHAQVTFDRVRAEYPPTIDVLGRKDD